jgi:poly(A) polymerase
MSKLSLATAIVKRLQDAGYIAYFAGGWVRDFIMGYPSDDIDIATSAPTREVQRLFLKTIPIGIAFGIIVVVENEEHFEIATFRKDRIYLDGRHPTGVDLTDPEEDAKRRDFTINGMFYDPITDRLYDYVGGREDIERKRVCAIGDPKLRFAEDRLRMIRAVRYATRFGFTIEEETRKAILNHAKSLLPAVAIERVWQECKKMSQFDHFARALTELHALGILSTIFPDLRDISVREVERRVAPIKDYPCETPAILQLLALFPDASWERWRDLCNFLQVSRLERDTSFRLHRVRALLNMPKEWQDNLEPIAWARFYAQADLSLYLGIYTAHLPIDERSEFLMAHQIREDGLSRFIDRIQKRTPLIKGEDLLALGICAGPHIGKLLAEAERLSVNLGIENKEALLLRLRSSPIWPQGVG